MITMKHARQQHRREHLVPVIDKENGKRTGWQKGGDYVPFRPWARAQKFNNPSPKLLRVLRGGE